MIIHMKVIEMKGLTMRMVTVRRMGIDHNNSSASRGEMGTMMRRMTMDNDTI